jgi:hypothetical protein
MPGFMMPGSIDRRKLFAEMRRRLPPELLAEIKRIAAARGIDPVDAFAEMLANAGVVPDEDDPAEAPHAKSKHRRTKGRRS